MKLFLKCYKTLTRRSSLHGPRSSRERLHRILRSNQVSTWWHLCTTSPWTRRHRHAYCGEGQHDRSSSTTSTWSTSPERRLRSAASPRPRARAIASVDDVAAADAPTRVSVEEASVEKASVENASTWPNLAKSSEQRGPCDRPSLRPRLASPSASQSSPCHEGAPPLSTDASALELPGPVGLTGSPSTQARPVQLITHYNYDNPNGSFAPPQSGAPNGSSLDSGVRANGSSLTSGVRVKLGSVPKIERGFALISLLCISHTHVGGLRTARYAYPSRQLPAAPSQRSMLYTESCPTAGTRSVSAQTDPTYPWRFSVQLYNHNHRHERDHSHTASPAPRGSRIRLSLSSRCRRRRHVRPCRTFTLTSSCMPWHSRNWLALHHRLSWMVESSAGTYA